MTYHTHSNCRFCGLTTNVGVQFSMHRVSSLLGVLMWAFTLPACSEEHPPDDPATQVTRQGLTAWDIDRTRAQAEAFALSNYVSLLGGLDSGIQTCLSGMGVTATTLSVSCDTSPIQSNYTTPYPLVGGTQVGAECYWKCKVEVPSQGMTYQSILILKELLTPAEVTGGC